MMALETGSPVDDPLSRVRAVSRIMAGATAGVMTLALAGYTSFWFNKGAVSHFLEDQLSAAAAESFTLTTGVRAAAFAVSLLPLALYVSGGWNVWRLFRAFADGRIFTEATGRRIGWIGLVIAVLPLASIVTGSAWSLVASIGNPPGEREISMSLGTNLVGVVLGILLVVVGWVIREAARIADENQFIV